MKSGARQLKTASDPAQAAALLEHLPSEHGLNGLAWRFVPQQERQQVLAVEALLSTIGCIPGRVSDPGVALAKLAWWRDELRRLCGADVRHPLTRVAIDTGAAEGLEPALLDAYLAAVADEVDAPAPATFAELKQRLVRSAGSAALLRTGVQDMEHMATALRAAGAGIELLGRLESMAGEPLPGWLPMELIARFALRRGSQLPAEQAPKVQHALATEGLEWLAPSRHLERVLQGQMTESPSGRFLLLRLAIARKRLERLSGRPDRCRPEQPPVLREVVWAWRMARSIYGRGSSNG